MLLNGGTLDGSANTRPQDRRVHDRRPHRPRNRHEPLREWPNINGYGFGLGVAVRRATGAGGAVSSRGEFHWAGSTGTYFWVDPAEELAVVFMAHAPGAMRFYLRQLLHALVIQAVE